MFIFVMGRLAPGAPPLVSDQAASHADPLPQALVLTALATGFGMTALVVVLAVRARHAQAATMWTQDRIMNEWSRWIIMPVALLALLAAAMASVGVLAGQTLRIMAGYLDIASVRIICIGTGMFSAAAIRAALYYLARSTLAVGLLSLLIDLVRCRRAEGLHEPPITLFLFISTPVRAAPHLKVRATCPLPHEDNQDHA